ncbi:MAG: choice-of-anchor J domain-containing protein [Muribaculaceae bacterium]|nr:choice-of-anchor J domain-containing protein [Muribaculaceae bacterium]
MNILQTMLPALCLLATTGMAAATPMVAYTPTEQEAALFTVADNNHDNVTWGFYDEQKTNKQGVFYSNTYTSDNASAERPFNDWLFMPAISFTDANALYELSFEAARATFSNYYGLDEVIEVKLGTAPNAQAMTQQVMTDTHLTKENNRDGKLKPFTELFSVPAPGQYYIGFHITTSDKSAIGIYLANIAVTKQQASVEAPASVTNIAATPGRNGELTATLVFYMPNTDIKGNPLPADTEIRAVATSAVGTKETTGTPGSACMIADLPTVQGVNEITVTTYIGDNGGKPATVQIYTGVSIPGAITNPRCKASDDNLTLRYEWDPPTRTADGQGFVSPTGNTYIVYEELMNNIMGLDTYYWNMIGELPEDQTHYEITVPDDGRQRRVKIGVVCKNAAGVNNQVVTPIVGLGGRPYQLPVIEDFTGCSLTEFNYNPITNWDINTDYTGQTWTVNDPAIIDNKYNIDHKPVLIFSNHVGTRTRVAIPKISTRGAASPTLKMMVYMGQVTPDMAVYAQTPAKDWFKVGDISIDRTAEKYRMTDIDLGQDCADQPWVMLAIDGYFDPAGYSIGFVSEYTVINSLPVDLGIFSLSGKSPVAGQTETFTATVYNPGQNDAVVTAATFEVEQQGRIIASHRAETPAAPVEPLSMCDFQWHFTPLVDNIGQAIVRFTIDVTADSDPANNTAEIPVVIKSGGKVVVRDLTATETPAGVDLSWTEPAGNILTEGFEAETPFERQPESIAGFTTIDGDGYQTWNFGEKDPMGGAPRAWTVWDGPTMQQRYGDIYPPYQGDRYLMVNCPGDELAIPPVADDWLISPEINPLSYVAFQTRPVSDLYGDETLDVMYSTTTDDPEAFTLLERMAISPTYTDTPQGGTTLAYIRHTTDLPADARYFALRYVSHDVFGIMLDNLEYAPASADNGISGYRIYRDGNLIADNAPAGGRYTDTDITDGSAHTYTVYPITDGDNGAMSNKADINGGSAIGQATATPATVKGLCQRIAITTAAPTAVTVTDIAGVEVAKATVSGTAEIEAAPGVYIVVCGTSAHKVAVR